MASTYHNPATRTLAMLAWAEGDPMHPSLDDATYDLLALRIVEAEAEGDPPAIDCVVVGPDGHPALLGDLAAERGPSATWHMITCKEGTANVDPNRIDSLRPKLHARAAERHRDATDPLLNAAAGA